MSTMKSILRASTVAAAGLAFSACASNSSADRYGNAYDYESNGKCATAQSCGAASAVTSSRYGDTGYVAPAAPVYAAPRTENVIYADCSVMNNMNCGHTQHVQQVQTYQPAPVYSAPVQTQSYNTGIAYGGETAPCPAGTTAAGDGTCMQSGSTSSYGSTSTTQAYGSVSMPGTGTYSGGETAPCPSGTTAAGDGTCMQSSYGSSTQAYGSVSMPGTGTYSGGTSTYGGTSYGGEMAACPSGTSKQSDGSCAMNEGMSTGSVEIYNAPATTSGSYGGYTSTGGYTANDYMPVRK